MSRAARWHCTNCGSELARCSERGTVHLFPARAAEIYVLRNGHHLIVCQCGRRNLVRSGARMLVAAPSDQEAQGVEMTR